MNWQLTLTIIITATLVCIVLIAAIKAGNFIIKRWGEPAGALWIVYIMVVIIAVLLGVWS